MRKALLLAGLVIALGTGAGASPVVRGNLLVFAAASLTDAFREIGRALEHENPGLHITFNFAASSLLRTQIQEGAPADVFASADERNMRVLEKAGLLWTEPTTFVRNEPVVVVPVQNPARIASVRDLARPGVKIVIAPADVPIGAYARQILSALGSRDEYGPDFAGRVARNIVSQEPDVRASLARVALGEADATFAYRSDTSSGYGARVRVVEIPRWANVIATYPIAVVRGAPNPVGARRFVEFVVSPPGQRILIRWGFLPARD